jgi:hypothetical protein
MPIMTSQKSSPVAPKPEPAVENPARKVAGGGAGGAVIGAIVGGPLGAVVGGLLGSALGAGAAYTPDESAPKTQAKNAVSSAKRP